MRFHIGLGWCLEKRKFKFGLKIFTQNTMELQTPHGVASSEILLELRHRLKMRMSF